MTTIEKLENWWYTPNTLFSEILDTIVDNGEVAMMFLSIICVCLCVICAAFELKKLTLCTFLMALMLMMPILSRINKNK